MRNLWLAAAVVSVAVGPATAQVPGLFTKVVDTAAGPMFNSLQPWAGINNSGLVAFQAVDSGNRDRFFTAVPGQNPIVIADNNQTGRIYASPAFVPVSDRGDVPFWRQNATLPAAIFQHIGPSGPSVPVAVSPTYNVEPTTLFGLQSGNPNINSLNQVVFFGQRSGSTRQGVHVATYNGSSVSYTTIAESTSIIQPIGGADLNVQGTAAFKAVYFPEGGGQANGLFIGGGGVPVTVIADNSGPIADFGGWPVLNDSGVLVYEARFDDGHRAILRYENGNTTPVFEAEASLLLSNPSLNNRGQIAFRTRVDGNPAGPDRLLIGPNLATDTVIKTGDSLDGSTVTFLEISSTALNDSGQIVFTAVLADGRTGIYVFTPVPEPGAVLAVAGLGLIVAVVRRRLTSLA
jgi:hypothetical protein